MSNSIYSFFVCFLIVGKISELDAFCEVIAINRCKFNFSIFLCYILEPWQESEIINHEAQAILFRYATFMLPPKIGEKYPELINLHGNNNQLRVIKNETFKGLWKLENLYLQDNNISVIESGAFDDLISVQVINLNNNNIEAIEKETFSKLLQLTQMFLNHNCITRVDPNAFDNNYKLDRLELQGNFIEESFVFNNLSSDSKVLMLMREVENMSGIIHNLQSKALSQNNVTASSEPNYAEETSTMNNFVKARASALNDDEVTMDFIVCILIYYVADLSCALIFVLKKLKDQ